MLPFDYARCKPVRPDAWCRQCARWAEHPQQTWGPRTPVFVTLDSRDEECQYVAIKAEDERRADV